MEPRRGLLKGYAAEEIVGKHFSVLYPPEAIERRWPQRELKMAQESGRLEDEGWRLRKDGSRFWANVVITALHDESGALRGFSKITRDLTERRRQQESLRQSEERFRVLVEGVKDYAMFMLDPDGQVTSWNAGAERIHGYKAQEILGRHISLLYPQAIDKKWPEQELALAREHGRFEDEAVRVRNDGTTFWANITVTPSTIRKGSAGYANVTRDLTHLKRVQSLEKAERQASEFLATLAHELRNPLAPINNALHLLGLRPAVDSTEKWVREVLHRPDRADHAPDGRPARRVAHHALGRRAEQAAPRRARRGARGGGWLDAVARASPAYGLGRARAGRAACGAGRRKAPHPGAAEPAPQCREVHAGGRAGGRERTPRER